MIKSACRVTVIFSDFNDSCSLLTGFRKNTQVSSFMSIRLVRAKLFQPDGQTDRQTDMTKLMVPFRFFAKAPKSLRK